MKPPLIDEATGVAAKPSLIEETILPKKKPPLIEETELPVKKPPLIDESSTPNLDLQKQQLNAPPVKPTPKEEPAEPIPAMGPPKQFPNQELTPGSAEQPKIPYKEPNVLHGPEDTIDLKEEAKKGVGGLFRILGLPQKALYKGVNWINKLGLSDEEKAKLQEITPRNAYNGILTPPEPKPVEKTRQVSDIYGTRTEKYTETPDEDLKYRLFRGANTVLTDPAMLANDVPAILKKIPGLAKAFESIKDTGVVKDFIRKPYNKILGGQFGELSVDNPALAKDLTTLSQKIRGQGSITEGQMAELSQVLEKVPAKLKDKILQALQRPDKLGGTNFEVLPPTLKRANVGTNEEVAALKEVPGYGTPKKLSDVATPDEETQIKGIVQNLQKKGPEVFVTKQVAETPMEIKEVLKRSEAKATDAEEQFQNFYDKLKASGNFDKKALQDALSGKTDFTTGDAWTEGSRGFELRTLNKLSEDLKKANQDYLQTQQLAKVGKAPSLEAMKAKDLQDQAEMAKKGIYRAKTYTDEGIKNWLVRVTKSTPEIKFNPVQKKLFDKLKGYQSEIVQNYQDIGVMEKGNLSKVGTEGYLPQIEEGSEKGRYFKGPKLMPTPPKGGLIIDKESGKMMTLQEANRLKIARGEKPFNTDLDMLFSVGLKESREQKVVNDWMQTVPGKYGKEFKGVTVDNQLGPYVERTGILPNHDIFTHEELKQLPGSFSNKQFPEEVVNYVRKGLDAGHDPLGSFGKYWDGYQNAFKSWALASPKYLIKNKLGNVWNNYLADVNYMKYTKPTQDILSGKEGQLGEYSYDQIRKMLAENDVLSGIFKGEIPGLNAPKGTQDLAIPEALKKHPQIAQAFQKVSQTIGARSPVPKWFMKQSGQIESFDRAIHVIDKLAKGKAPEDAIASMYNSLFDYNDLSSFQRNFVKRAFIFPTFPVKNIPYQIEMMAKRPDKFAVLKHFYDFIDTDKPEVPLQDWVKEKWPFKVGKYYQMLGDLIPAGQLDTFLRTFEKGTGPNAFRNVAGEIGDTALNSSHPIFSAIMSAYFNKNLLTGGDLEAYPRAKTEIFGVPIDKRIEPYIMSTPMVGMGYVRARQLGQEQNPIFPEPKRSAGRIAVDQLLQRGVYDDPTKRLRGYALDSGNKGKEMQKAIRDLAIHGRLSPEELKVRLQEFMDSTRKLRGEE